ncbi:MAG: hydrogenase maturation nickel metallochaperone HypA, partial [Endomicrobiia bacterium]
MHELGIAKDLFELVKKYTEENSLSKVTKIVIKIGAASGIDKNFLRHSFVDHILPGTFAENSAIEFDLEPVKLKCKKCNEIILPEGNASIT